MQTPERIREDIAALGSLALRATQASSFPNNTNSEINREDEKLTYSNCLLPFAYCITSLMRIIDRACVASVFFICWCRLLFDAFSEFMRCAESTAMQDDGQLIALSMIYILGHAIL